MPIGVNRHHRARQRIGRRQHVTARRRVAARRRRARVREVIVDLAAHALDLLHDRGGQLGLPCRLRALGLLIQQRQRRLQAVREIAGLGQRARHALLAIARAALFRSLTSGCTSDG